MIDLVTLHRWNVTIRYRTRNGFDVKSFAIEEISELDDIIESGPDWNTIVDIVVKLQRRTSDFLTVEQSLKL